MIAISYRRQDSSPVAGRLYDRLQADDLKQASVIMAAFVYHAAMADEKVPRKPLESRAASPAAPAQPAVAPAAAAAETAQDKVPAGAR